MLSDCLRCKTISSISTGQTRQRNHQSDSAFTLVEVTLAMIVFLMMVMVFAAVFPLAARSAKFANYYAQASMLAQHKIDQVRYIGFSKLQNAANLSSLEIADSGAPAMGPPYTVSFTNIDNLTSASPSGSFFPPGSTGTVKVVDYSTVPGVTSPPPAGSVDVVTVTVNWSGSGLPGSSYATSGLVIKMPHQ